MPSVFPMGVHHVLILVVTKSAQFWVSTFSFVSMLMQGSDGTGFSLLRFSLEVHNREISLGGLFGSNCVTMI